MATNSTSRRIVGVSTKMYFSAERTRTYMTDLLSLLSQSPDLLKTIDIFMIPDFVTLSSVIEQAGTCGLLVGAQDCHSEDVGAFTGEVSPAVLAECGVRLVELGHAERRRLFGETDESTAAKAAAVARNGMWPLVCIGERTPGEVAVAVAECMPQVEAVLVAVPDAADFVLAYEPVWAIGAAEPAGVGHVCAVVDAIKASDAVSRRTGSTRVLYGGSADPGLFSKLKGSVDGLFLGRFAHNPEQFYQTICEIMAA